MMSVFRLLDVFISFYYSCIIYPVKKAAEHSFFFYSLSFNLDLCQTFLLTSTGSERPSPQNDIGTMTSQRADLHIGAFEHTLPEKWKKQNNGQAAHFLIFLFFRHNAGPLN